MSDVFTKKYFVESARGEKYQVFPCLIADKDIVREKSTLVVNDDNIVCNFLVPKFEDNTLVRDENGKIVYDDDPVEALLDILYLAFDKKYTKEEIAGFCDVVMAKEVYHVFMDISNLKKNLIQNQ